MELSLGNLAIIIGANASGKSNFISIFRFISNIVNYGLDNAISLLGGIDYTVNTSIGKTKPIKIKFNIDFSDNDWIRIIDKKKRKELKLISIINDFEITPHMKGQGYRISKDELTIKYEVIEPQEVADIENNLGHMNSNPKFVEVVLKKGTKTYTSTIKNDHVFKELDLKKMLGFEYVIRFANENKKELLLNLLDFFLPPFVYTKDIIKIFDFDPKLLKKASSIKSLNSLEEDGSNLANVLQVILKNREEKQKLVNLLSDCLPFIDKINVEKNIDRSISFKVCEKYNNKYFHSSFISDGTVNVIAIIVALYFTDKGRVVILEEPERNLHPKLMDSLIEMAKEASSRRQVIITTHNPELIKHADIEDVILARRCSSGFTSLVKANDDSTVNKFLNDEICLSDLYVDNMLG
jgi:predicted ATPase